ncbi:DUF1398 family protein [Lactococcus garvieae]|uniref:DUF1398 family protein n=1 Tax=Lactococcus garvieae TaxID=1363 RepID=UPI0009BCF02C|nr:DUF1398 family protein [Lactococcus garvieae]
MISQNIHKAMLRANQVRPLDNGFPYLAECLRQEGIIKNIWHLPSCDSFYFSESESLVNPGNPLIGRVGPCPSFNQPALVQALRSDQAGKITFPEFLLQAWKAGVIRYEVDFIQRHVTYYGAFGETYKEDYPPIELEASSTEKILN